MSSSKLPRTQKTSLPNGLTILYLHTKDDPISAFHLFLPGGADLESDEKAGMTTLLWSMLLKGTKKRPARKLAEDIESIGASISAGATHDYSEISCHSVSDYFLPTLEIMRETLLEPAFPDSEVLKEKTALMAAIRSKKENIFAVASEELNKRLFAGHPYSRPASGHENTVEKLNANDLKSWHTQIVVPNRAILAAASNVPFSEILPHFKRLFGPEVWPRKKSSFRKTGSTGLLKKSEFTQKNEHFEQAFLVMGFSAPALSAKDYMSLKVVNACLGGGMSARLFQTLREKEGLAYDVGSFYPSKMKGSAFVIYMGLQASRLEEAKKRIQAVIEEIRRKKVGKTELRQTVNYLKGTYILDHQTNSQRAHYLGWWYTLGLNPSFDLDYINRIGKVSVEQVKKAAEKYLGRPSVTVEILPRKTVTTPKPLVSVR